MNYIYWLSQIQSSERSLVGDKLFILSQLLQHECPILPGFVLGNNLLRQFLANIEDVLDIPDSSQIDVYDDRALQSVARLRRQATNRASFPKTWQSEIFQAARQLDSECLILQPVATTSYPQPQIDRLWQSHTCKLEPTALATAIKLVWSELFTASSLFYWHKLGLSKERVNLAVLIRPLKAAYASGIIELNSDAIQIKASWGLEQSLLQGEVEPDEYFIERHTGYLQARHLGHKNYAYRPKTVSETLSVDCLEAYVPEESLAETYVLDREAIALLLQLTQNVLAQQPQIKSLAWTVLQRKEYTSPLDFYFTQLQDRTTTILAINKKTTVSPSGQPLLSGVPVSPGSVRAKVVVVKNFDTHSHQIPIGSILVAKTIPPQHISLINTVGGIITETGGKTSHGAIVARELKIPAVVKAIDATNLLRDGDEVLLDGNEGKIYPATVQHQLSHQSSNRLLSPTYPIATKLMVNLSQPESIASVVDLPIDGVGLLRSELMLADFFASTTFAHWQESFQKEFVATLTNALRRFASAFTPRPVFYRSLDRYARDTANPVLGDRGAYSYLSDPTLFDLELAALATITAEGYHNLNLILPFVRGIEEFKFCYRRVENIGLTALNSFRVWMMAEVPSAILLLPEYVRAGVNGIAIGTNDLTQLVLGVDREQTQFSDRGLNANHPAMHLAISKLIETATANQIECSICGQAPVEYPSLIDKLIQWGITTISVEPEAVSRTYRAIARAERRILLKQVKSNM